MERYRTDKEIGKGSYGVVYLDGAQYVQKRLQTANVPQKEREAQLREVRLLQHLRHPNIVNYHESFEDRQRHLCIIMEYCQRGDLYQELKRAKGRHLPEKVILDWFAQMALALHYLHTKKVLHRDLKSQNIFLTADNQIKLGDFGIAKVLDGTAALAMTVIGTPYYMSPELYNNKPYSFKSDCWSMGCILYEMVALKHAFDAKSLTALGQKVCRGNYAPPPPQYGSLVKNLIKTLLNAAPSRRPSMSQVLSKPAIRNRVHMMLECLAAAPGADPVSGRATESQRAMQDSPLGKLCAQLDALNIPAPVPEEVRRLKDEELREEETRRARIQAQLARLNPRAVEQGAAARWCRAHLVAVAPPARRAPARGAGARRPSQQAKPAVRRLSADEQAVRELDKFSAPGGLSAVTAATEDKVTVMESAAAIRARKELLEIQNRLEALQALQSKLSQMDDQVDEELSPERPTEPSMLPLPPSRYPKAGNNSAPAPPEEPEPLSAKERVLRKKEAERLQQQRQYEAQLKEARIENAAHHDIAAERKKVQYGHDLAEAGVSLRAKQLEQEYVEQLMASTARIEQLKIEHGGYDEPGDELDSDDVISSDSEELSISDSEEPCESSGNLDMRSQVLRKRCMDALGNKFVDMYTYLKQVHEGCDDAMTDEAEEAVERDLCNMVGLELMGYRKLVEQIIFIEECLG